MENKKAFDFWINKAENTTTAIDVKLNPINDHTQMDADFILKYADKTTSVLDLGTGTGLIVNKLYDRIGKITCVKPFESFTKYITRSDNIKVEHQTLMAFEPSETFDLITVFGVMHYFNEQESVEIYKKYFPALKKGGKLIVKNQFGVSEDVIVDGYSEEQKTDYFASYRHIDKEVKILETIGYKNLEVVDIYPPEYNQWANTHFYAVVAEK